MARIINIEKSKYINDTIQMYASNKIGQYSKFLDKNPMYLTYYSINAVNSRTDVGTGGINEEIGPASPIRFNKINSFPIYNIPDLKPDVDYSETGYDTDLDLSDLIILPNTIRPKPGDYLLLAIPGTKEFLFRVNNYRHNSIQSNDFYQIDVDLKDVGSNLENRLLNQIVEVYETIFENIGTENKCFVRTEDVSKIESIGKLFLEMRDFYYNNFFNKVSGSFVMYNDSRSDSLFYDMYLNKFIMESEIYYTDNQIESIILACNDTEPMNMDFIYSKTLLYAIYNRTPSYLSEYIYYYNRAINKILSPFVLNDISAEGVEMLVRNEPYNEELLDIQTSFIKEYYSRELIDNIIQSDSDSFIPKNYIEELIYNYMCNSKNDIQRDKLIKFMISHDLYSYMHLPIVMYIIMKYYDSYFTKIEL